MNFFYGSCQLAIQKLETCGHIMQVILDNAATNTLYLSALYNMSISDCPQLPISVAAMFIQTILYENPVWDIGLQHKIVTTNPQKIFNMEANKVDWYMSKYICPCGILFRAWHIQTHISELPKFHRCNSRIFKITWISSNIYMN